MGWLPRAIASAVLLLLVSVPLGTARAATMLIVLDAATRTYDAADHMEVLEDPTRTLTFEQVSAPAFANRFAPIQRRATRKGYTTAAYFIRLTLENPGPAPATWYLEPFNRIDDVELYRPLPEGGAGATVAWRF